MTASPVAHIFDGQEPLPSKRLTEQGKNLLGFEKRFQKISKQLRLLMHLGDLQKWSQNHHGGPTRICAFVASQYPLVIFHGDVGTGKTVTAESIANRLVEEDDKADDSILFKLSTRVRGSGIRLRLYPAALAKAYPDSKLKMQHLLEAAKEIEPTPVIEDT